MGRLYICPRCRGKGHTHSGRLVRGDLRWDARCSTCEGSGWARKDEHGRWVRGVLTREAVLA